MTERRDIEVVLDVHSSPAPDENGMVYVFELDQMMTVEDRRLWRKKIERLDAKRDYMRTYRARKKAEK